MSVQRSNDAVPLLNTRTGPAAAAGAYESRYNPCPHSRAYPRDGAAASSPTAATPRGGTAFDGLVTLCCGCAGAGILSLPFALKLVGVVPGAVMIAVVAAANVVTLRMLAVLTDRHRDAMARTQYSYETLVLHSLGPKAGTATGVIVFLTQFGSLVAFLVILVGLAVPVFEAHHWLDALSTRSLRAVIAFSLCIVLLFPLSLLEKIHQLSLSSLLAIVSVLWTAAVIIFTGAKDVAVLGHHELLAGDADWLGAMPIVVFGFNCHQQMVPIHGGTTTSARAHTRGWVVVLAISICCILYVATATAGYARFGNSTNGNILLSFKDSPLVDSAKLVMVRAVQQFGHGNQPYLSALQTLPPGRSNMLYF